jgi:hypothetical protein
MKLQWTVALKVTIEPFRIDPAYDVFLQPPGAAGGF